MKGDIPEVAFRLSCSLGARTHERKFGDYGGRDVIKHSRRVMIAGSIYESITAAARETGKSRDTLTQLIRRGKGAYL